MSGDGLGDENNNDEDDDSDFDIDETDLESYSTILEVNEDIDEFQIFCDSLQRKFETLKTKKTVRFYFKELQLDTTGYNQALLQSLTAEQRTQIQNIIHYTEKRKQEKGKRIILKFLLIFLLLESNKLREVGGYNFPQSAVTGQPTNFNFGGSVNNSK